MSTNTYNIENKKISLSDAFEILKLPETPFINTIKIGQEIGSTHHKWDDDKMTATSCLLAAAYVSGDNEITVDDASSIRVDMVLQIDLTLYLVTAVNPTTKVVTLTLVSDADAAHDNGSTVKFINNSRAEGSEYQDSDRTEIVERENFTQIMTDYIAVTGTADVVDQRHFKNEVIRQAQKKLERLKIQMNRVLIMGVAYNPGSNSRGRMMGGVMYFLEKYGYVPASTTFSESNLDYFLQTLMNKRNFRPTELWMNPLSRQKFNDLQSDKVMVSRTDGERGEFVEKYLSGTGLKLDLKDDSDIPAGKILALKTSDIQIRPLKGRSFFTEELAKTGDLRKFQIVGEYTAEYNNSARNGIFTHSF